jgi:hypothetical protein
MDDPVREGLAAYPQIYHACHIQHPRRRTNPASLRTGSWILGHLDTGKPMSAGIRAVRGLGLLARAARQLNMEQPKRWQRGGA